MTELMVPNLGKEQKRTVLLMQRASAGDEKAFRELRPLLVNNPDVWRQWGDVAALAQKAQIQTAYGKDLVAREGAERDLDRLRSELILPTDEALERLLIERILTCHVALAYAEVVYAQQGHQLTLNQAKFHQRRISAAQQRYLSAIRTLATVRKLAVPAVQINVAERQVNVAR